MAKDKQPAALSEAQLEIMNVVWELGEVTVGEVWDVLSARRGVARNTVQTTMVRLEEKGWLRHRTRGQTFFYTATKARRETLGQMAEQLVKSAFAGSVEGLILTVLADRKLSKDEADRIRKMIEDSETKQSREKS